MSLYEDYSDDGKNPSPKNFGSERRGTDTYTSIRVKHSTRVEIDKLKTSLSEIFGRNVSQDEVVTELVMYWKSSDGEKVAEEGMLVNDEIEDADACRYEGAKCECGLALPPLEKDGTSWGVVDCTCGAMYDVPKYKKAGGEPLYG